MKAAILLFSLLVSVATTSAAESFISLDREQAERLSNPLTHTVPTILALWSSECMHCKKTLALYTKMAAENPRLKLITVATEFATGDLAEPLNRIKVQGERYAYGSAAPEVLAYALDPKWHGELPRTLFFDGRGGMTVTSGVMDEAFIRRALGTTENTPSAIK